MPIYEFENEEERVLEVLRKSGDFTEPTEDEEIAGSLKGKGPWKKIISSKVKVHKSKSWGFGKPGMKQHNRPKTKWLGTI